MPPPPPLDSQSSHADFHALDGAERELVLAGLELLPQLASQAQEFEYTLKLVLRALCELTEADLAGLVVFSEATAYGLPVGEATRSLGEQFQSEAQAAFRTWEDATHELRDCVLWNRRQLFDSGLPAAGEWLSLPCWGSGQLLGTYLLHHPTGFPHSPQGLGALSNVFDHCLTGPYLLKRHEAEAEMVAMRFSAVKEMLYLFRDINNPNFPLEYLLILLGCVHGDRGIFWECDRRGGIARHWAIGVPAEISDDLAFPGEPPIWKQVLESGAPLERQGALTLGSDALPNLASLACRKLLVFPLIGADTINGVVALFDVDFNWMGGAAFLDMVRNIPASYLDATHAQRKLLKARELEHQVAIAREVQQALLPSSAPQSERFELLGVSDPAAQLGGDLFHFFQREGRLQISIGDVSGKGVGAGLLMSMTRALLEHNCRQRMTPGAMLAAINDLMVDETPADKFVTLFHCRLDESTGLLEMWNGGHDPAMIYRALSQTVELMNPDGLPLGIVKGVEFERRTTLLQPGDVLLLFTDGLPEAMSPNRTQFSLASVEAVLRELGETSARQIRDGLFQAVHRHASGAPQHDDTTVIVLRALPVTAEHPVATGTPAQSIARGIASVADPQ